MSKPTIGGFADDTDMVHESGKRSCAMSNPTDFDQKTATRIILAHCGLKHISKGVDGQEWVTWGTDELGLGKAIIAALTDVRAEERKVAVAEAWERAIEVVGAIADQSGPVSSAVLGVAIRALEAAKESK